MSYFSKSPWIIHYDASSCNGCDIEVLACLTPMYDVERFGIINTGNPKHADIFLVTGSVNEQNISVIQNIYHQLPEPKVVVAIGICATSGGIFRECYNVSGGIDKVIPVDVYVPGCAARPEAIIDGVVKALGVLEEKYKSIKSAERGIDEIMYSLASKRDLPEILALQKIAYQSEAELYNDYSIAPLQETLQEIHDDFAKGTFFKAHVNAKIIGSVRGAMDGDTARIKRLVVHPYFQHRGIGRKLLATIENHFTDAKRFELHTGHKSTRYIRLYSKCGYNIFKKEKISDSIERIYLEKSKNE